MSQNIEMQYLNSSGQYEKMVPHTIASDNSCFLSTKTAGLFGLGTSATPNDVLNTIKTLLNEKAPSYTYGTSDLTAGSSSLATGTLYFVYE